MKPTPTLTAAVYALATIIAYQANIGNWAIAIGITCTISALIRATRTQA